MTSVHAPVRAMLFDCYGTLMHITDKRAPYAKLLERCGKTPEQRRIVMTLSLGLFQAASLFEVPLTKEEQSALDADLATEVESIVLYPETRAVLKELRQRGYLLGLCSNLAAPYARPAFQLVGNLLDCTIWSFEVGAIKPEPEIYAEASRRLGVPAAEILMVGDSFAQDVQGARQAGLQALHLARSPEAIQEQPCLHTLSDLLPALA